MSRTADDLSSLQQTQSRLLTPPNASKPASLTSVYAPIVAELKQVETILKTELRSETPFVDQLLEHSWLLGGKRIRPVFLLLVWCCRRKPHRCSLSACRRFGNDSHRDTGSR